VLVANPVVEGPVRMFCAMLVNVVEVELLAK
jgi:hypothetical protein